MDDAKSEATEDVSHPEEELRQLVDELDASQDDVFSSQIDITNRNPRRNKLYSDTSVTPLISAVRRGSSSITRFLDRKDQQIDIAETDKYGRNAFHYSVNKPNTLKMLLETFKTSPAIKEALHKEDKDSQTPIHEAAFIGNKKSLEVLFEFDNSLIKLRSKIGKRTVLHYAVKGTSLVAVQYVLNQDPKQLDMMDSMARTAVHYAANLKQRDIIVFLISKGVDTTKEDANGQLPIHGAAYHGFLNVVEVLLQNEPGCIDYVDSIGQSPLALAAESGFDSVVAYLLNKNADYKIKDSIGNTAFDMAVINNRSEVIELFFHTDYWKEVIEESRTGPENCLMKFIEDMPETAVKLMDKCIIFKGNLKEDPQNYKVIYDFFCLDWRDENETTPKFDALSCMVDNECVECLSHPLCVKYINREWRTIGFKYYAVVILISVIFHTCLMIFTTMIRGTVTTKRDILLAKKANETVGIPDRVGAKPDGDAMMALRVIILIIVFGTMIKELLQMWNQRFKYLLQSQHYIQWALLISVLFYLFPVNQSITARQLKSGSISVLLSWTILIQFLQMVPMLGVYILAVIKVFWTLMKILVVIALFLLSFSTTFYILLAEYDSFNNFGISVVSSFNGMINGLDYETIFVEEGVYPNLYDIRLVVLFLFVIIMSLVVNNTLIGLAVGDTEEVMKSARLEKFRCKVQFIIHLEQTVTRLLRAKIVREERAIEYPKRKKNRYNMFLDFVYSGTKLQYMGHESWREKSEKIDDAEQEIVAQEMKIEDHLEHILASKMEVVRSVIHQEVTQVLEKLNTFEEEMEKRKEIEEKILEKLAAI